MMNVLNLFNIPSGSHIGLDLHSWQSGPNFRGIRAIPDGLHCVHLSITGIQLEKYAIWLSFEGGVTHSYKWDMTAQTLAATSSVSREQDLFLVECPAESDRCYDALTKHLTVKAVQQYVTLGKILSSTSPSNIDALELRKLDEKLDSAADEPELSFTSIDLKRSWKAGATGRELTEQSLDKSWLLHHTIDRCGGSSPFLAEFSFCFLSALLYGSLAACDHFNTLLLLVANAQRALAEMPSFYAEFIALLHLQMQQVPHELFMDVFSLNVPQQTRIMQKHVKELTIGDRQQVLSEVAENIEVLLDFLHREFNVEIAHEQDVFPSDSIVESYNDGDSEPEDEKPVVVGT